MRVAALYDVHGNLPALEAVLAHVERENVDIILSGGDVVFGPMPAASLDRLLSLGDRVAYIRGNTDRAVARPPRTDHMAEKIEWVRGQLSGDQIETVFGWPETLPLDVDGIGRTLFVHATPRNDTEIITPRSTDERLLECLEGADESLIVCGHIHVQYEREVAGRRIVNAGSVGAPFGRAPGAYWAIFGPDVRHMYTPYDVEAAAAQIRASGMPGADAFAEDNVLHPPSLEHALEKYARKAKEQGGNA
jgi:putative phosphoesterase